ncbi:MAG: type 2 isopentenyl-diphosphate Delta-isomerase, partial [Thermomicrobiales bacterium]
QVEPDGVQNGFERFTFRHSALPEVDFADIDLAVDFLGRRLSAPILISSMTGGVAHGWEIIRRLAMAAQAMGCAMGVGSQRAAIEDPARERYFAVRDIAPDILLFANLGAIQLNYGFGIDHCRRAVEMIGADALILHLNPLQEALQPDGDRNFSSLAGKIEAVCATLEVPVVVKEVGSGISESVARTLVECGVAAIDVSGSGGTSWSAVEHFRATDPVWRSVSRTFADWGIPTAESLLMVRKSAPSVPVIASGGMRNGIEAAKALALGASVVGFAGPLLRAAAIGEDATFEALQTLREELRLAMFCTGSRRVADLTTDLLFDRSPPPMDCSMQPARPSPAGTSTSEEP